MKRIKHLLVALQYGQSWLLIGLTIVSTACEPSHDDSCNCGDVLTVYKISGPIPRYGATVESWCTGSLMAMELSYTEYMYTSPGDVECFNTEW